MKGTNKPKEHTETLLVRFDSHNNLCLSEENKCEHTVKIEPHDRFEYEPLVEGTGRMEGLEGK